MPKLFNLARMTTATAGTGTITLGIAVSGYLTFAQAGVVDQNVVFYGVKDGANSECGFGTYTASGTTLTRNVVKSTNSNAAISLSGSAEVYLTAVASDGGDLLPGFDHPLRGFDAPINLQINASVASSVLTVSVQGNNAANASNTNPILIPFRDPTAANGDPVWRAVTGSLSVATVVGASQGAATSTPFRLWLGAFDNGGTVVLGLYQSIAFSSGVFAGQTPWNEAAPVNTTGMTSGATSAGVWYTPNGTSLAGKSFRILGYLDLAGLTTPGTYTAAPATIQLFGPGVKKCGDVLQRLMAMGSTSATTTSTTPSAAGPSVSPTPAAAPNFFAVAAYVNSLITNAASVGVVAALRRGTTQIGATNLIDQSTAAGSLLAPGIMMAYDLPGGAATYQAAFWTNTGGSSVQYAHTSQLPCTYIQAEEIMA